MFASFCLRPNSQIQRKLVIDASKRNVIYSKTVLNRSCCDCCEQDMSNEINFSDIRDIIEDNGTNIETISNTPIVIENSKKANCWVKFVLTNESCF